MQCSSCKESIQFLAGLGQGAGACKESKDALLGGRQTKPAGSLFVRGTKTISITAVRLRDPSLPLLPTRPHPQRFWELPGLWAWSRSQLYQAAQAQGFSEPEAGTTFASCVFVFLSLQC